MHNNKSVMSRPYAWRVLDESRIRAAETRKGRSEAAAAAEGGGEGGGGA